jgi:hypothetical protein
LQQAEPAFLSLANGIPSQDTFRRVFMPDAFETITVHVARHPFPKNNFPFDWQSSGPR